MKNYVSYGDTETADVYRRQNIEWLKTQIEELDESEISDKELKKMLIKELDAFLTLLIKTL